MTSEVLLDTDVLSNLMRGQTATVEHARRYLEHHERFTFSIITRYEILRGLKAKDATAQVERFNALCSSSILLPLDERVIEDAATIYAALRKTGSLIGDADILIAATARVHRLVLSTNNQAHFTRIQDLACTNWTQL